MPETISQDDANLTDLSERLFLVKEYLKLVSKLRTQYSYTQEMMNSMTQESERDYSVMRKNLKGFPDSPFKELNTATLNTIIDFACLIPDDVNMDATSFENETSIQNWLRDSKIPQEKLNEKLTEIEEKQKIANNLGKVADFLFLAAEGITEIAHIPVIQIIAIPIMDGLYGLWYAALILGAAYNPELSGRVEQAKTKFNMASGLAGTIATVSAFVGLIFPLALPLAAPIAAIAMLTSNVLWSAAAIIDFYKEIKSGNKDAGSPWRIASKGSSALYILGSVVIAALALTALLTPVGWAVGAGALAFGIGAASSTLAVFAFAKFCEWRGDVAIKAERATNRAAAREQTQDASPAPTIELTSTPQVTPSMQADVEATAQVTTQASQISSAASAIALLQNQQTNTPTSQVVTSNSSPVTRDSTQSTTTPSPPPPKALKTPMFDRLKQVKNPFKKPPSAATSTATPESPNATTQPTPPAPPRTPGPL